MSHMATSCLQMISFTLEGQKETKSIRVEAGGTQTGIRFMPKEKSL